MSFSQIITSVGLAKIAAALGGGPLVDITEVAVGDTDTTPALGAVALGNEVWRGPANLIAEATPDRVRIEATIPVDEAEGYTLREAGAFDADGDLILIARIPDTYKPDLVADGASVTVYVRLNVEIANAAAALSLTADPSTVLATREYVDTYAIAPFELHVDGGASKHDASEIDDETVGGYHGATVQLTIDSLSTGLGSHLDGGANKHDASEVDFEQPADPSQQYYGGWTSSLQSVLQQIAMALPIACGIFKLAHGADALVDGAGWDAVAPITRTGVGRYQLKLSEPVRAILGGAIDTTGWVVHLTVGAHGAGFVGSYAWEHNPSDGGRLVTGDTFTVQCGLPAAHAGAAVDVGPAPWAADPAANDSDGVRLMVTVYSSINFLSVLPALVVVP